MSATDPPVGAASNEPTRPYVARRRVEFRDTDLAGVAHFSMFYVWMEQAEHEALRSLGLSVHRTTDDGTISWPRVSAECTFLSPVRFEETLDIEVRVGRVGAKSVTYVFTFRCGEREVARGRMTNVCCEVRARGAEAEAEFESIAIPPDMKKTLLRLATA